MEIRRDDGGNDGDQVSNSLMSEGTGLWLMIATERGRGDLIWGMCFNGALMDILTNRRNVVLRQQQEVKRTSALCLCPVVVHGLWKKRKLFLSRAERKAQDSGHQNPGIRSSQGMLHEGGST